MKNKAEDRQWAELNGTTLTVMHGLFMGCDDNGVDIITGTRKLTAIPLPDTEDETWIKALADIGFRPLPDTVSFDGVTITFQLEQL